MSTINWTTVNLSKLRIEDQEQGREYLEEIAKARNEIMQQLPNLVGEEYRAMVDQAYNLKQARVKVQSLMTQLFKAKRGSFNLQ